MAFVLCPQFADFDDLLIADSVTSRCFCQAENAAKSFKLMEAKLQKDLQEAQMTFESDGGLQKQYFLSSQRPHR